MENKQSTVSNSSMKLGNTSDDGRNDIQMVLAKMMEEKHTYTYKKLVVPPSMRSIYWKFFGFPATEDGDILTKVKIVCILCKTQIAYNRNTSNLRMHLQNKHAQELLELESSNPPCRQIVSQDNKERKAQKRSLKAGLSPAKYIYTTNADGTVQIDGDIQFVTDPNIMLSNIEDDITIGQPLRVMIKGGSNINNNNQNVAFLMSDDNATNQSEMDKTLSDAVAEFIVMDLQLPEIVEGRGFQRLVATLRSPCEIPSKNKLEDEIIPKIYDTFRESVAGSLTCITSEIALTFEEWKSNDNESFVTISVYYLNVEEEAELECKILSTIHTPSDWEETHWNNMIDTLVLEWNIKVEKITAAVVSSSRPELIIALSNRGLILVPCLLHTLQTCAQACFDNPDVAHVLSKCRAVIGTIISHPQTYATLALQEQLSTLKENGMLLDYPGVWISTHNMLEQLVLRRNIITTILQQMEGIDQEMVDITSEQWKIMEDLVAVLEPFKVTTMTLSEEKIPQISLLKPLLWQLVSSHLKVQESDSETAKSFKESLSDMLCERYADGNVTLLLQIATTLDPRFKAMPYVTEEDKNIVSVPIKEMLTKLISEECGNVTIKNEDEIPSKKSRLSGMELLLGGLCATKNGMPAEEKADLELIQYQSEATASLDSCPLQWWLKTSAKCPNLTKLANKYHCVPACCAPPTRIPPDMQIQYDTKRAALPPHLIDKLLFLHGNHTV